MKKLTYMTMATLLALGLFVEQAEAKRRRWVYEVKVTNVTKGTNLTEGLVFTPILLATHERGLDLFELGEPATAEMEQLAEGGDTAPLATALEATDGVYRVVTTGAPLLPGHSVTVDIPADRRHAALSLASMILPSNDGFIGFNGLQLPGVWNQPVRHTGPAYDAGTEINDELCASIPGPHCGGEGFSAAGGEGKVHVHSGIHGVGDLAPENYDWRNPVVSVSVYLKRK